MRAALIVAVLLATMLLTPIEASAELDTIDFFHSYAVDERIDVDDIGGVCWWARWNSSGQIITSGINATITGGIPLNYSESLGAWYAEDNHSDVVQVTYYIESAVHENATGFIQTAPNVTITWDRIVIITNTTPTTPTKSTDPPDPPFVWPVFHFDVFNSSGLAFAGFLAAIITLLWKVNRDE